MFETSGVKPTLPKQPEQGTANPDAAATTADLSAVLPETQSSAQNGGHDDQLVHGGQGADLSQVAQRTPERGTEEKPKQNGVLKVLDGNNAKAEGSVADATRLLRLYLRNWFSFFAGVRQASGDAVHTLDTWERHLEHKITGAPAEPGVLARLAADHHAAAELFDALGYDPDGGSLQKFVHDLNKGAGQAVVGAAVASVVTVPAAAALAGGAGVIDADPEASATDVTTGAAKGLALGTLFYAALKGMRVLPRPERMTASGLMLAGDEIYAELQKPPEERDFSGALASFMLGAGMAIPGGPGKSRAELRANVKKYFGSGLSQIKDTFNKAFPAGRPLGRVGRAVDRSAQVANRTVASFFGDLDPAKGLEVKPEEYQTFARAVTDYSSDMAKMGIKGPGGADAFARWWSQNQNRYNVRSVLAAEGGKTINDFVASHYFDATRGDALARSTGNAPWQRVIRAADTPLVEDLSNAAAQKAIGLKNWLKGVLYFTLIVGTGQEFVGAGLFNMKRPINDAISQISNWLSAKPAAFVASTMARLLQRLPLESKAVDDVVQLTADAKAETRRLANDLPRILRDGEETYRANKERTNKRFITLNQYWLQAMPQNLRDGRNFMLGWWLEKPRQMTQAIDTFHILKNQAVDQKGKALEKLQACGATAEQLAAVEQLLDGHRRQIDARNQAADTGEVAVTRIEADKLQAALPGVADASAVQALAEAQNLIWEQEDKMAMGFAEWVIYDFLHPEVGLNLPASERSVYNMIQNTLGYEAALRRVGPRTVQLLRKFDFQISQNAQDAVATIAGDALRRAQQELQAEEAERGGRR